MMAKIEFMTRDRGLIGSFLLDAQGNVLGSTKQKSLKYSLRSSPSPATSPMPAHGASWSMAIPTPAWFTPWCRCPS